MEITEYRVHHRGAEYGIGHIGYQGQQHMEKEVRRERGVLGVNHGGDVYSG